jgi:hypothetical protein
MRATLGSATEQDAGGRMMPYAVVFQEVQLVQEREVGCDSGATPWFVNRMSSLIASPCPAILRVITDRAL